MRTAKTLIWLGGCQGWSESSLGAHAILLVLSWGISDAYLGTIFLISPSNNILWVFIRIATEAIIMNTHNICFIMDNWRKLELVFIKHYAPNSLHLTVNSHHVLFVKMLAKFSKGHNSGKNKMIFFKFNQVIYSSSPISWPSFKPLAQTVSKISWWQI